MLHPLLLGPQHESVAFGLAALIAVILTFIAWIANYAAKCAAARCTYVIRAAGLASGRKPVQRNVLRVPASVIAFRRVH